jgi:toxin HigB-1
VILGFADKRTAEIANGTIRKGFPADLVRRSQLLLAVLNAAVELNDLRSPPGNRLEKLRGDKSGQYSIRINDQWRICFEWSDLGAKNVSILDYH